MPNEHIQPAESPEQVAEAILKGQEVTFLKNSVLIATAPKTKDSRLATELSTINRGIPSLYALLMVRELVAYLNHQESITNISYLLKVLPAHWSLFFMTAIGAGILLSVAQSKLEADRDKKTVARQNQQLDQLLNQIAIDLNLDDQAQKNLSQDFATANEPRESETAVKAVLNILKSGASFYILVTFLPWMVEFLMGQKPPVELFFTTFVIPALLFYTTDKLVKRLELHKRHRIAKVFRRARKAMLADARPDLATTNNLADGNSDLLGDDGESDDMEKKQNKLDF